jgi:hypothetical protein
MVTFRSQTSSTGPTGPIGVVRKTDKSTVNTGPVQGPVRPTGVTGSIGKKPGDYGVGDLGYYGTKLDPMLPVKIGGITFESGTQAANYLIQLRYSGKTAEYNRLVGLLKAGGATGKTQDDWEAAIARAQRADVDLDVVLATDALNNPDIAASAQSLSNIVRSVQRTATKYGIKLSDREVKNLATQSIQQGWDAATLAEEVARKGRVEGTAGEAAKAIDDLREYANAYGVKYNDDWYANATKAVLEGRESLETFQNTIRDISKSRYGGFAAQIDAGLTTKQAASPYIQSMASILELDPNAVNLDDPTISKALTGVNEQGAPAVMPLWQFERELKKDSRWRYTKNAQEELLGTGMQVLRDLGFEA